MEIKINGKTINIGGNVNAGSVNFGDQMVFGDIEISDGVVKIDGVVVESGENVNGDNVGITIKGDITGANLNIGGTIIGKPAEEPLLDRSLKNNLRGKENPDVNNDVTEGYSVKSIWLNGTDGRVWRCADNVEGAAVWEEIFD